MRKKRSSAAAKCTPQVEPGRLRDLAKVKRANSMSENNEFTLISDGGEDSGKNTSVNPADGSTPSAATPAVNEGGENTTGEGERKECQGNPDVTGSFKERLDRMRRRERERSERAIKENNEAWEKRFKALEDRLNAGQKPNVLNREDFSSDEEFINAKRQKAMEELMNAMDKRNADKEAKAAEEKAKQDEEAEYQRKFAERFTSGMKKTLSEDQQKKVLSIVDDEDSEVNVVMSSKAGSVLQNWIMEDCEIPADVILYLEEHADKMKILTGLSPRKQVGQLDILERYLAKAKVDAMLSAKGGERQDQPPSRKVPVMGQFGGSTQAVGDDSQLSDQERVAKLIKAMRKR